jgi:hypothetical protein
MYTMRAMGRGWVIAWVAALCLALAPGAMAKTQTAHSGQVTATLTFSGKYPSYHNERLKIARAGHTVYDAAVHARFCSKYCAPLAATGKGSSVHVIDLEHTGQPDVVLELYSGGAHCCAIDEIFTFDPGLNTYVKTEHNFADPGARIVDLGHNGRYEFLTANDAFAYAFTDYAASGMPIEILTFSNRRFHDVTKSYPKLIAHDAASYLRIFKHHHNDSLGVAAAWAADECLLGHSQAAFRYLNKQAKAGHLKSALGPGGGTKFIAKLRRFLRKLGYLH